MSSNYSDLRLGLYESAGTMLLRFSARAYLCYFNFFHCLFFERLLLSFFRSERPTEARETNVHEVPDARAREGVPHESLPHAKETHRDGSCAMPDGETDQNMVPKPTDEVKERDTGHKGVK